MNRAAGGPSILLKSRMCGRAYHWPRATWTNWPLNPDLRQRQLTYLVQPA